MILNPSTSSSHRWLSIYSRIAVRPPRRRSRNSTRAPTDVAPVALAQRGKRLLESVATIRRLVTFYVDEHNHVLPHSAFRGQTPDEMYFGTGDAVPADLTLRAAAARRARVAANRSASCETCPSLNAAA